MMPGGGGVEGRDPSAKFKVEQLINQAVSHGPSGKLYIATDAGGYQNSSQFDRHGRLLVGSDQGIWRSGGVQEAANRMRTSNNLKQLSLGCNNGSVDIIVTDAGGTVVGTHRLTNVSVSPAPCADSAPQRSRVTSLTVTFNQVV
jgi:ligand-binding sensor domain-containing protein